MGAPIALFHPEDGNAFHMSGRKNGQEGELLTAGQILMKARMLKNIILEKYLLLKVH